MRKIQNTIHLDGTVTRTDLGTVAMTRLDADRADERRRASRLARTDGTPDRPVEVIEDAANTLVVVWQSGTVRVIQWVAE